MTRIIGEFDKPGQWDNFLVSQRLTKKKVKWEENRTRNPRVIFNGCSQIEFREGNGIFINKWGWAQFLEFGGKEELKIILEKYWG